MKDLSLPGNWKYTSSEEEGLHEIITPENSACKLTWIFRLNLKKGREYILVHDELELNPVSFCGDFEIGYEDEAFHLSKLDAVYLPARQKLRIKALEDINMFIGGTPYEGKGEFFVRKYDLSMPIGNIRQVHGESPFRRDVFMLVNQEVPASRMITGITTGDPGMWTSWPPHQHSNDLEEVYCYFDIPSPRSAFHFASRRPGEFETVLPVSTGDCVVIPEGYHPTLGMPGVKSSYYWIMAAHRPESRRYDLAVNDPVFS
ncbi:MAG: 5-deoxy-glucuronate isomerase [Bacteroidales bacterium]